MSASQRTACRACGSETLTPFLTLGPTPLANAFLAAPEQFADERRYPLDVYFCRTCSLVQLADVVDPHVLFGTYLYVTGTSDTIVAHNRGYAHTVVERLSLGAGDLVVEVASNNGHLLQCFQPFGVRVLGVEPAANIAQMAEAAGVPTVNRFFNAAAARELVAAHGPARAVIGNNVLAHVDDPQDFLRGCATLLAADGAVVIEVPYLREFLDAVEFDTVYHEHLCYFSVTSLMRLCDAAGLAIAGIDRVAVHGGSIRMYARRSEGAGDHAATVLRLVDEEAAAGLHDLDTYQQFAARVEATRAQLVALLERLRGEGKSVAAYGAPAKGNTLLNYCGIDTRLIEYTVDKNPLKVGLYTPGAHLPVLPVSTLLERQPDYVLILAWNFADEIMRQQDEYRARGGRFILPIPEPRIAAS